MATQNFQFIDGTKHDRETRRLARSHAMKGKNAGRKLHRRSRKELGPPRPHGGPKPTTGQDSGNGLQSDSLNSPPLIDTLQFVSFPVNGLPECQYIIHHFFNVVTDAVYLPALSGSLEEVRLHWLRVLFQDQISYHCTVTLMHTFNDFFTGRETVSQKGLYHLSQAVKLVNQTLDTPAALSLSNLIAVNLLILQAMLKGGMSTAAIHLAGMRRMLDLRGGLSRIEEDWLAVKFCKTEFDYALHYGTPMSLYRDRMDDVYMSLAAKGFRAARKPQTPGTRFSDLDRSLQQVMFDMWNVSALFNAGFKMDPNMLQDVLVSIGSRLIRFHSLGEPPLEDWFEEACHAGMIAFTTTFVIRVGPRRFFALQHGW